MKALITGASSGIGYNIALELAKRDYELIVVARCADKLENLKKAVGVKCQTVSCDLSVYENCIRLCEWLVKEDITVVVNCAGFGVFGEFVETDLGKEVSMINTNITALHIITKFFAKKFIKENKGYILNVSSVAAYAPGPMFSSYYATKAYVLRLTQAIAEEVRGTDVYIGALCPGTADTEFNSVAGVGTGVSLISAEYIARYAIDKMFKRKNVIIPGFKFKCAVFFSKFVPDRILSKITLNFQKKKNNG